MAEETVQETVVEEAQETQMSDNAAEEEQPSQRPSPGKFAGYLFGGWLALMVVLVVFAAVAMTIVGGLFG